ncbi:hypothetical protein Cyast_0797 [Cyanobacterium stanieri PCC 7202]|uniref:DUF3370 domain-containing protein n=1 Tax=Cyanobacterium stanieri (strain ATCC 29140 / PCC 7202) TaxID=292563 RepID=K9YIV1_CYASC|nr:hypothetical protein Cyast_0797 [Cyanobacterium stanieri PCC 7202]
MLELLCLLCTPNVEAVTPETPAIYQTQAQTPENQTVSNTIRPLNGELNQIPVFNSNSPELVLGEGILLSTFSPENKNNPDAHLDFAFNGEFDVFAHHVSRPPEEGDMRTLYIGILMHNPTDEDVNINILQGATYLSQPDAPFISLPSQILGRNVFAGPGSRVMGDILQNRRQEIFPESITIPAGESRMLLNVPIPIHSLTPPLNGRSTYVRLRSDGEVRMASLAMYRDDEDDAPEISEWQEMLTNGELSSPRDLAPTPPDAEGAFRYGRVAGVSIGNMWRADLVDDDSQVLNIPNSGEAFSYGLSTLVRGRLGSDQVQTAPLAVRYSDTAFEAHGNYGVQYSLTLPLYNPTNEEQTVRVRMSTPIKKDVGELEFLDEPGPQVFFRGLVQVRYTNDEGLPRWRYFHLVQRRGEEGQDLLTVNLPPNGNRLVSVDFLYPPDATPPQILTVMTD